MNHQGHAAVTKDEAKIAELRQRLALLEQVVADLPALLARERTEPRPTEHDVIAAQEQVEALTGRIRHEKNLAKRHQRERKAWLDWHAGLTDTDKVALAARIERESVWRNAAIHEVEQRIVVLEQQKLAAIGAQAAIEARLGAADAPFDRRLDSAQKELDATRRALREALARG